ncbi:MULTISPECIES: hypothetical protein [Micromonospora]|uniref:hypothetical protein n=1 Tax=Micromonospora TaxID=1873 RepID=UPI00128D29C0|nr:MULTISPECIES: hypothetical protein [unclassified Micromonospora]MDG4756196.1 hypothetical protein [Micromonospora sp. WMMD718]
MATTPNDLAERLGEVTANLDAYISAAAERLAAPRIADAEKVADERIARLSGEYEARLTRAAALELELRRQLDRQLRNVAELRWAARYLPAAIRGTVLVDPYLAEGWTGDRPQPEFVARVEEAATAEGVLPYPGFQRSTSTLPDPEAAEPDPSLMPPASP